MYKKISTAALVAICLLVNLSCKKEWLEERSDKSIVIPQTLKDFQALLDNSMRMNGAHIGGGIMPALGEIASDDYYLADNVWNSMAVIPKNAYIWNKEIYEGNTCPDWNKPYMCIFYANVVLEGMENVVIDQVNNEQWNNVKGSALFYRAHAFFQLAQVFCSPYDETSAAQQLGLPLRLSSDFNEKVDRSTLAETYNQILADLNIAYELLPEEPLYKTRPSKAAVKGLLARIYLIMGDYGKALEEANACLKLSNRLIDFNTLDVSATLPFARFNEEDIFDTSLLGSPALNSHIITAELYAMYNDNDLRKIAYFREVSGNLKFKGSYVRSASVFYSGIAVDEIYLIRAECYARLGDVDNAMADLNTLLATRWRKDEENGESTFMAYTATDQHEAIELILKERRKELLFRGIRWMDLRRLNREGRDISLLRVVNGQEYRLEPNAVQYTFPIPDDVLYYSGIAQN